MVDVHMQSVNPVIGRFIVKVDSDIRCVKSNTHAITQHQWVPIHVSTNERVNQSVDAGNLQQLVLDVLPVFQHWEDVKAFSSDNSSHNPNSIFSMGIRSA